MPAEKVREQTTAGLGALFLTEEISLGLVELCSVEY
jgi:hypothetical protein